LTKPAFAQLQNLLEQIAKRLQVPLAEIRDAPEIRRIERHNADEIDPFAAGLGDAPRGVDAAAVRIKQQGRHHGGIKRRLAPFAGIGAGDFAETEIVSDQAQHKAGEMVLATKSPTIGGRNSGSSIFQARNVLLMHQDRI
jgi:hypothetical protein